MHFFVDINTIKENETIASFYQMEYFIIYFNIMIENCILKIILYERLNIIIET